MQEFVVPTALHDVVAPFGVGAVCVPANAMWCVLYYYGIWNRHMFWSGPPAPKEWDPIAKHISNSDVVPFEKREAVV